jgi:hypothetical protein
LLIAFYLFAFLWLWLLDGGRSSRLAQPAAMKMESARAGHNRKLALYGPKLSASAPREQPISPRMTPGCLQAGQLAGDLLGQSRILPQRLNALRAMEPITEFEDDSSEPQFLRDKTLVPQRSQRVGSQGEL